MAKKTIEIEKRSQKERLTVALSILESIRKEIEKNDIDFSMMQIVVNAQMTINKIVTDMNRQYIADMRRKANEANK